MFDVTSTSVLDEAAMADLPASATQPLPNANLEEYLFEMATKHQGVCVGGGLSSVQEHHFVLSYSRSTAIY